MASNHQPHPYDKYGINLASERLGTVVLTASDDFFAPKENLIKPGRGIFIEDKYTDRGKWMDGWESRRRRGPGYDTCIVKLGLGGVIHGLDIDTNYFTGNHPPFASVDATYCSGYPDEASQWREILAKSPLGPGCQNLFKIDHPGTWTHLRLNIYPDGGVARFKAFGEVRTDWSQKDLSQPIDLAALVNQGRVVICSDMYFSDRGNLILPGPVRNMGDGWETKRRRGPGHDWVILALGREGICEAIDLDTSFFKGNYPDRCQIEGIRLTQGQLEGLAAANLDWQPLLLSQKLKPHHGHRWQSEIEALGPITHVRLNIYPDGGVGRLRVWGRTK